MTIPDSIGTPIEGFRIRCAGLEDVPLVLHFIRKLAEYEKLTHEVEATEEKLAQHLFGQEKTAEVVIGFYHDLPVGFALYFKSFSTFLARPGIYLEDLYVLEDHRGKGFGTMLLAYLARLVVDGGMGRLEWSVLDWNKPSIRFYKSLGARLKEEWIVNRLTGGALVRLAESFEASD